MKKHLVYTDWTFGEKMPEPFNVPVPMENRTKWISRYNNGPGHRSTLHSPSLRALMAYARLQLSAERCGDGGNSDLAAVGKLQDGRTIAELPVFFGRDTAAYNRGTGYLEAVRGFNESTWKSFQYLMWSNTSSGAVLFLALMPVFAEDEEFARYLEIFKAQMDTNWRDREESLRAAFVLSDNMYRRIVHPESAGKATIPLADVKRGLLPVLDLDIPPDNVVSVTGKLSTLGHNPPSYLWTPPPFQFRKQYHLGSRVLSEEEQDRVPEMPEWYLPPREVDLVCTHAMGSDQVPGMRNFMLRGPSGTGKTMAARMIAAALHLPYVCFTCSATTEVGDLIGQFVPADALQGGSARTMDSFGRMNAPAAYFQLTGEYDAAKTRGDVVRKWMELSVARNGMAVPEITYVESPILQAFRNGWLVEIQEPSSISQPGVLVGLNGLLDGGSAITLPDGQRIQRHPDCIVILTTNTDYAGTREINESVLSRMNLIVDFPEPDADTMTQRTMRVTGCADEEMVRRMVTVVRDIQAYCRSQSILDGSCGMRELIAWAASAMVTGDPYRSALYTVIASATEEPEGQAELITACLERQFTSKETKEMLADYGVQ